MVSKLLIFMMFTGGILVSYAVPASATVYLCANCYWEKGDHCGTITPAEVVEWKLVNHNPGVVGVDKGPFGRFACDNGHTQLGVEWSDQECGKTGGLSGIPLDKFPGITDKPECKFGAPAAAAAPAAPKEDAPDNEDESD